MKQQQQEEEEQLEEQLVPSAGEPSEHLPSFIIMEVGHLIIFFFFLHTCLYFPCSHDLSHVTFWWLILLEHVTERWRDATVLNLRLNWSKSFC